MKKHEAEIDDLQTIIVMETSSSITGNNVFPLSGKDPWFFPGQSRG